jgi:hypothetical protein
MYRNGFIWNVWVALTVPSPVPIHDYMGSWYDRGKDC